MHWPKVQVRHVTRFRYGDSLPSDQRAEGFIPVYGSNGQVGTHSHSNTRGPTIVIGRKGSHGKLQFSPVPVFAIDTTYVVDQTTTHHHVRWLYYALQTARLEELSQDVGVPGLNREDAYAQRIPLPGLAEQITMADFLDTETARIDALTTKKRRLTELLDERSAGAVEVAVRAMVAEDGEVPLKRLVAEVTVGIVVTPSEWYAPEGVVALRGLNIRPGRIDAADVVHLTQEGHHLHRKSALRQGDVVVVRTGQAGAAAVVPSHLDGANCVDLLIVRPGEMDSEFLTFVLNSDWTQKHVERNSVGSIQSHFNVGALRELPVPNSSLDRQHQTAQQLRLDTTRLSETRHRLSRQIELLHKRRQALITAAVTGELRVPGVAA